MATHMHLGDQVQPSDFPHGLMALENGAIAATDNLKGLAQAYSETSAGLKKSR